MKNALIIWNYTRDFKCRDDPVADPEKVESPVRHQIDFRQVYAGVLENWLGTKSEPVLGRKFEKLAVV